jgi:FkbM family methyltransferase
MPELTVDRRTGLVIRSDPAFHDREILREVRHAYRSVPVRLDDVILDLGAHIGASACFFVGQGARRVVAVEASPENFALLERNAEGCAILPIHAAVNDDGSPVTFHLHPKGHAAMNSVVPSRRPHREVTVPGVALDYLLTTYEPTVLKMDIEWAEYGLSALHRLPDRVRVIAAELHMLMWGTNERREEAQQRGLALEESFLRQGFRSLWREEKRGRWNRVYAVCGTYER